MARYLRCFFALLLLAFAGVWWWVAHRPMAFMNASYAMSQAKLVIASQLPPRSLVIFGDSRAMAGLKPDLIGTDVYNLALGGSTPIEALALARVMTRPTHAPRAVVLSFAGSSLMQSSFWERGVRHGLIGPALMEETRERSRRLGDPLFGPATAGDMDARFKIALFSHRFPSFYFPSLVNGRLYQRRAQNEAIFSRVLAHHGQFHFDIDPDAKIIAEACVPPFKPMPLLDEYFRELIAHFQQQGVPLYFMACPVRDDLAPTIPAGHAVALRDYLRHCEELFSCFHVVGDVLPILPSRLFSDQDHLNPTGTAQFSKQVAQVLSAQHAEPRPHPPGPE